MGISGSSSLTFPANPLPVNQGGTGGNNAYAAQNALSISYQNNLQKWGKALAGVYAGVADAKILFTGDSNIFGYGSSATTNQMRLNGIPSRIRDLFSNSLSGLTAKGVGDGFYGNGGTNSAGEESSQYDSRITVGAGWATNGAKMLGGSTFTATSATSNLSYVAGGSYDRVVVTYFQFSGGGTFSWQVNAGATNNIDTNGGNQYNTVTITISAGDTVNIDWVSGTVFIVGFYAYINANKSVICLNAGWNGSTTANWDDVVAFAANIQRVGQNLTVCILGKNDANTGVAVSTARSQYQTAITDWLTQGDVILCTYPPDNPADSAAIAVQNDYQVMIRDLAKSNNIGLVELYNRFQSYSIANTNGLMNDSKHPNGYGYAYAAKEIFRIINNA